jgi:chromosomal replication initiation ATPase DnaA
MYLSEWPAQRTTIRSLAEVVSTVSGLPVADILGPRHTASEAKARQIVTWLSRRYTKSSTTTIATHTGRKDHTTVLHSAARVALAIREANIAAPASDTPEAWTVALWEAAWPPLNYRRPRKVRA